MKNNIIKSGEDLIAICQNNIGQVSSSPYNSYYANAPMKYSYIKKLPQNVWNNPKCDPFFTVLDQAIYTLTSFLVGIFLAHSANKDAYGVYVLILSLIATTVGIQYSLVLAPLTVYCPSLSHKDSAKYIGNSLMQQFIIACITATVLCLATITYTNMHSLVDRTLQGNLILMIIIICFREFIRRVYMAKLKFKKALFTGFITNAAILCFVYWEHRTVHISLFSVICIISICSLVPSCVALFTMRKSLEIHGDLFKLHLKRNWDFGKWLVSRSIVFLPAQQMYPWLLAIFSGPIGIGAYGASLSLASPLAQLAAGLNAFIGPKTAHEVMSGAGAKRVIYKSLILLAPLLAIFIMFALVFGKYLLLHIYGKTYAAYSATLSIFAIGTCFSASMGIIDAGINAFRRPDIGFKGRCLGAAFSITVGIPLVWSYGVEGAAIGYMISNLTCCVYSLFCFRRLS